MRFVVLAVCILTSAASTAAAQSVAGLVREQENGRAVAGVFITLHDSTGRRVAARLTDQSGAFSLRSPAAGYHTLRAQHLSHRTYERRVLLAVADPQSVHISLEPAVLRLAGLQVDARARCARRPQTETTTAAVWEQARKALEVAAWMDEARASFHVRKLTRFLALNGLLLSEDTMSHAAFGSAAYRAAPADSLITYGFVQKRDAGFYYYGPDASVLLSEAFQDTHCFRTRRDARRPGLIGLQFEPLPGRTISDIAGTLWLDEQSGRLRSVEYEYTNILQRIRRGLARGRSDFEYLANGAWITRRWLIRMPVVRAENEVDGPRVTALYEEGGEVLDSDIPPVASKLPLSRIHGVVRDSLRGRPLAGATVFVSGHTFRSITDDHGQFELNDIPIGDYTVAMLHPALDSLPARPAPIALTLGIEPLQLNLAIPGASTVVSSVCTPDDFRQTAALTKTAGTGETGMLFGTVFEDGEPLTGALLRVSWRPPADSAVGPKPLAIGVEFPLDARGGYRICGVPRTGYLTIWVVRPRGLLATRTTSLRGAPFQRFDVALGSPR